MSADCTVVEPDQNHTSHDNDVSQVVSQPFCWVSFGLRLRFILVIVRCNFIHFCPYLSDCHMLQIDMLFSVESVQPINSIRLASSLTIADELDLKR